MRFLKIFLLAITTLVVAHEAMAQRHINVGAEVWIEPNQTPEEIEDRKSVV